MVDFSEIMFVDLDERQAILDEQMEIEEFERSIQKAEFQNAQLDDSSEPNFTDSEWQRLIQEFGSEVHK